MTFYLSMTIKSLLIWILIILILIAIAFVVGFCIGSDGQDEKETRADERAKTIEECFKAIREQAEKALRKQNQERHDKGLALYQQDFDCFSTHKIEFDIFREVEKQMKEVRNERD